MKEESKTWIEVKQSQLDLLNKKFGIALKLVKRIQSIRKLFGI